MDKVSLLQDGKTVGEMTIKPEGLYTLYHAHAFALDEAVQAVYLVGDGGELRLGVLEKKGEGGDIVRRLSNQSVRHIDRVKKGEIRLAQDSPWQRLKGKAFRSPYLQTQCQKTDGGVWKPWGTGMKVGLPYYQMQPYLLMSFFCFAQMEEIEKTPYLVVTLTEEEQPVVVMREKV